MKIRVKSGETLRVMQSSLRGAEGDVAIHGLLRSARNDDAVRFELEAKAHLEITQVTFVEDKQTQHWQITFLGEQASCRLNFLDLVKKSGYLETKVEIFHQAPNCQSKQLHKGLYTDEAQGFLKAYVSVPHGALGTDASQLHRSLLLSPNARVHAEPHLEINADAVQCRHGASIGQLDTQALFYLQARGLSFLEAQRLLIQAFAAEVLNLISDETGREKLNQQVLQWI